MKTISVAALRNQLQTSTDIALIDVRESAEHAAFNIGGMHIPLGDIITKAREIPIQTTVVVYCKKGVRSQIAIQRLEEKFGFTNLYNLTGGMEAWQRAQAV